MPGKTKQGQKPTASMANSSVDRTNLPLPEPTVGFGQVSTFGGPVPTPELDKPAARGLRFHTTAICGPSRAALIAGRNHHNCGVGFLAEWATGFPNYNNMIPKSTAAIGAVLKGNGYNTS